MKLQKYPILCLMLFASLCAEDRIITVGGTATELVFALGAGDKVVAVDQSSLHPSKVQLLPQVGYIRMISSEGILALEPSKIITSSEIGPKETLEQLKETGIPITVIRSPDTVNELYEAIDLIGEALNSREEARKLKAEVNQGLAELKMPTKKIGVLFLMHHPYVDSALNAAGKHTKANTVIELAGGENLIDSHNGYKNISEEAILSLNPSIILLGVPENLDSDNAQILDKFYTNPLLKNVRAIKDMGVRVVPLSKTLSFSHRIPETMKQLSDIFKESIKINESK
jgi:iron complex transport system substrate-binding protein